MVCLFWLLLLVSLAAPLPATSGAHATTVDYIRLLREFGEEESVHNAIRYHEHGI